MIPLRTNDPPAEVWTQMIPLRTNDPPAEVWTDDSQILAFLFSPIGLLSPKDF
jgi:hypothetical protein